MLPLIITGSEWERLARGLRQRARLLNAMAADLYGAQALLSEGRGARRADLPASRLPARVSRRPSARRRLPSPRGLRSRPRSRRSVARPRHAHPGAVRSRLRAREPRPRCRACSPTPSARCGCRRWPASFRRCRARCSRRRRRDGETPHVVLLTPGPYNETYFEHAYLAKQLGFPLVEGGDLTVRHDRVFLKTVAGLRRVHALLRRTRRRLLRSAGAAPGFDAGRSRPASRRGGRARCSSPTRSAPACSNRRRCTAFLPSVCERLLGEPLESASLQTVWCGDAAELSSREPAPDRRRDQAGVPDAPMEPVFLADSDRGGPRRLEPAGSRPIRKRSWSRNFCRCRRRRSGTGAVSRAAR